MELCQLEGSIESLINAVKDLSARVELLEEGDPVAVEETPEKQEVPKPAKKTSKKTKKAKVDEAESVVCTVDELRGLLTTASKQYGATKIRAIVGKKKISDTTDEERIDIVDQVNNLVNEDA